VTETADHARLVAAVRAAGVIAMGYFRADPKAWEKIPGHVVSEADHAANDYLRQALWQPNPEDGWLSEESSDDLSRLEARRVWIVDPIDGTNAFLAGRPEFAVSAALVVDGAPVAAALYNPATDEMFEASEGGGARLNGEPMEISRAAAVEGASLISSRAEADRDEWRNELSGVDVSAISSMAYKLALVACGRYDACVTLWPKSEWDIAAAALLLSETGACMSDARGAAFTYNKADTRFPEVVAAGPVLHPLLIERLDTFSSAD